MHRWQGCTQQSPLSCPTMITGTHSLLPPTVECTELTSRWPYTGNMRGIPLESPQCVQSKAGVEQRSLRGTQAREKTHIYAPALLGESV